MRPRAATVTWSGHAAAVNAFFAHGHLESYNRNTNPYVDVARRHAYLFGAGADGGHRQQEHRQPRRERQRPGRHGLGRSREVYQNGMMMDAIVTSGTPNATTGPMAPYRSVAARAPSTCCRTSSTATPLARSTTTAASPSAAPGTTPTAAGHPDNSSSQWAAIGMIPAEREWGLTIPAFVKNENNLSIDSMWTPTAPSATPAPAACLGLRGHHALGLVQWIMDGRRQRRRSSPCRCAGWPTTGARPQRGQHQPASWATPTASSPRVKALRLSRPPHAAPAPTAPTSTGTTTPPSAWPTWSPAASARTAASTCPATPTSPAWAPSGHLLMLAGNLFAQAPKAVPAGQPGPGRHQPARHLRSQPVLPPRSRPPHRALRVGLRWRRQLRLQHRQPQRAADLPLQPGPQRGAPGLHRPPAGDRRPEPGPGPTSRGADHRRLGQRAAGGGHHPQPRGLGQRRHRLLGAPTASIPTPGAPQRPHRALRVGRRRLQWPGAVR
jgi:hypothetical protein